MEPGQTELTVMPLGATSSDKALDHPSTPILKLFDRNKPGTGVLTETDEMLMILPQFLSFMPGRTSFDKRIDDIMVRLKAFSQSSSFSDSKSLGGGPPALFIKISMVLSELGHKDSQCLLVY